MTLTVCPFCRRVDSTICVCGASAAIDQPTATQIHDAPTQVFRVDDVVRLSREDVHADLVGDVRSRLQVVGITQDGLINCAFERSGRDRETRAFHHADLESCRDQLGNPLRWGGQRRPGRVVGLEDPIKRVAIRGQARAEAEWWFDEGCRLGKQNSVADGDLAEDPDKVFERIWAERIRGPSQTIAALSEMVGSPWNFERGMDDALGRELTEARRLMQTALGYVEFYIDSLPDPLAAATRLHADMKDWLSRSVSVIPAKDYHDHATCDGSCDIALARRQVGPDGVVPGNAKECAEAWEREASRIGRLLDAELLSSKRLRAQEANVAMERAHWCHRAQESDALLAEFLDEVIQLRPGASSNTLIRRAKVHLGRAPAHEVETISKLGKDQHDETQTWIVRCACGWESAPVPFGDVCHVFGEHSRDS